MVAHRYIPSSLENEAERLQARTADHFSPASSSPIQQGVEKALLLDFQTCTAALNTLRKDGCLPYLLPRAVAGEKIREVEQAVIYQQPA